MLLHLVLECYFFTSSCLVLKWIHFRIICPAYFSPSCPPCHKSLPVTPFTDFHPNWPKQRYHIASGQISIFWTDLNVFLWLASEWTNRSVGTMQETNVQTQGEKLSSGGIPPPGTNFFLKLGRFLSAVPVTDLYIPCFRPS